MTAPGETPQQRGAEGECGNSQAEGSERDGTSERTVPGPDTKGATAGRSASGISQVLTEAERYPLSAFFVFSGQKHTAAGMPREKTKEGNET